MNDDQRATTDAPPQGGSSGDSATIGLVGVGLIGTVIAERLRHAGFHVVGWDRTPERVAALVGLGGVAAAGVSDLFARCDRVVLSLPDQEIVRAVLDAADGSLRAAQLVIDTTTGTPEAAESQAARLAARGIAYLDATISGSSAQLKDGAAVLLVGGDSDAMDRARDVLAALSAKVFHVGPSGAGARMKLVTNLVLGLNRAALAEGLRFAEALGLDLELSLRMLRESVAYSRIMDTKGEKMLRRDYTPQAKLSQHLKDVRLILDAATNRAATLPLTTAHRALLEQAETLELGELDNSAILEALRNPPTEGGV